MMKLPMALPHYYEDSRSWWDFIGKICKGSCKAADWVQYAEMDLAKDLAGSSNVDEADVDTYYAVLRSVFPMPLPFVVF